MEDIDASSCKLRAGVFGIETDVLYQWRTLVPCYEERLTPIRNIVMRRVRAGASATPFRILGDKDKPVDGVTLADITIGSVTGRKSRYENARNVRESGIRIDHFTDAPDTENGNR